MKNKNELILGGKGILGVERDEALNIYINMPNNEVVFNLISDDEKKDYYLMYGDFSQCQYNEPDLKIRRLRRRIIKYYVGVFNMLSNLVHLNESGKKEEVKETYFKSIGNIKYNGFYLNLFNFKRYDFLLEEDIKNINDFIYENFEELEENVDAESLIIVVPRERRA